MTWAAAETERRLANAVRYAKITAVDPGAGRARVTFGGETESAWLPFAAGRAGSARIWAPPSVGEQVIVVCPGGDTAQGVIAGSLASESFPAPSGDGEAVAMQLGAVTITVSADGAVIAVGGVSFAISAGGVAITGGTITHNGLNIGDTHTHGGVALGASNTQGPE